MTAQPIDRSREVIDSYRDCLSAKIVKVYKENGGEASALNAGFLASCGSIICILDSDDFFSSRKSS